MVSTGSRTTLERAIELALEAGETVLGYYGRPYEVERKGDASPITLADRAAHARIVDGLARIDPGTPVISEEAALPEYELRRQWRRFWLVDPLDGTKEFIAKNGEFTVNIALIECGEPILGVIVAPAFGLVYFASSTAGAWRREGNGETVRLLYGEERPETTRVVESRSHPSAEMEAFIATLGPVERTQLGSSLKFCRVAEGSSDVYPRFGPTMEWDVAAGDCIYRNAAPTGRQRPSPLVYNQPALTTAGFVIGQAKHSRLPFQSA